MNTFLFISYVIAAIYSGLCSPDVWFQRSAYRDGPEYAFAYFFCCLLLTLTLVAIPLRLCDYIKGVRYGS